MYLVLPIEGVWIGRLSDTSTHPLDDWVDGIRAGSEDAFARVYGEMADTLVSFAFGMVGDRRTAEDIVQQSFVELVKAAPGFRGEGKALRAWLYKSVRFGCLDEYRRRKRRPEIPSEQLPDRHIADDPLEALELEPALEQAMGELSKNQRTLIVLRHVVELSGEEIGSIMNMSRKAVYAAISRAESSLRSQLEVGDE